LVRVFDVTLFLVVVHWLDVEPRGSPIGYYVLSVRDWSRVVFGKSYMDTSWVYVSGGLSWVDGIFVLDVCYFITPNVSYSQ